MSRCNGDPGEISDYIEHFTLANESIVLAMSVIAFAATMVVAYLILIKRTADERPIFVTVQTLLLFFSTAPAVI